MKWMECVATKMHFQYVNNYGNKLAQIDPIDMVGNETNGNSLVSRNVLNGSKHGIA